jgi:hypothetical protein
LESAEHGSSGFSLKLRQLRLLDVSDWEFGRLHSELARLKRQGWEIAAAGDELPVETSSSGAMHILLARAASGEVRMRAAS